MKDHERRLLSLGFNIQGSGGGFLWWHRETDIGHECITGLESNDVPLALHGETVVMCEYDKDWDWTGKEIRHENLGDLLSRLEGNYE